MDKLDKSILQTVIFWVSLMGLVAIVFLAGCEVTREVVLNGEGMPTGLERVVVEGPGGDMVSVGHKVVQRLAPLLPEPWNTILSALAGGFTVVFGSWVFRSRKKK